MVKLEAVSSSSSPLSLLKQVRDVMRTAEAAQARLAKLVEVIAAGFNSEVCSIYFSIDSCTMELCASKGLNADAIHQTRLDIGEGLVGEIAALSSTLNLPEAQHHPKFSYREETGEERFHSFVGVPILSHHRVIGVLVVQSTENRIYSDEQIEILQTIAMVLAEMAIASQLVDLQTISGEHDHTSPAQYYSGMKLSPGLAKAPTVLHRPRIEITKLVSDNPAYEQDRLRKAIRELQDSVDALIRNAGLKNDEGDGLDVIETYRMFTHDKGWLQRIQEAIGTGLTAEAAVKKVEEQMHARLSQVENSYLRDRIQDLEDLSNRLLYHLAGISPTAAHSDLPDAFILIAKSIGPAELLEYANTSIKGAIVEEGSAASHVALIARMMDIPMVAKIPDITTRAQAGDLAIVDGDNGEAYLRPTTDIEQAIDEHITRRRERDATYESQQDLPAQTKDGVDVSLHINIGLTLDGAFMSRPDVSGIGLYRTELPYLASTDIPAVDDQRKIYSEILRQANGKPVTFRSFDIGGDKQVPYVNAGVEENPAMGWRATRIGLDRPVILRRQFRALIRAAGGHRLYLMFPFIADVAEFDDTYAIFEREMERAKVSGQPLPTNTYIGSMIEIPSLLYQMPQLLKRVDFVSIGSNDLLQFLYACDRGSERLSGRYDPLSPVFLNIVRTIVQQCKAAEVSVSFCGGMAAKPLEALALVGCGLRHISMPPPAIGPVKAMIRSLSLEALEATLNYALTLPDHSIRNPLEQFAKNHGVEI